MRFNFLLVVAILKLPSEAVVSKNPNESSYISTFLTGNNVEDDTTMPLKLFCANNCVENNANTIAYFKGIIKKSV